MGGYTWSKALRDTAEARHSSHSGDLLPREAIDGIAKFVEGEAGLEAGPARGYAAIRCVLSRARTMRLDEGGRKWSCDRRRSRAFPHLRLEKRDDLASKKESVAVRTGPVAENDAWT